MTEFLRAGNGEQSARLNATLLHSSYNPQREAERFVSALPAARCYLVIGCGLGHIASAIRRSYPDARLLTLHPSDELAAAAQRTPGTHWSEGSGEPLSRAISRAFRGEADYGFELVPWEPSRLAAPDWFRRTESSVLSIARQRHTSLLTTGYFGRRWLRNSLRNLREPGAREFRIETDRMPTIVAPGPTLETSLSYIRRRRDSLFILAVSSALPVLTAGKITPDLLVHTDGGFWARYHLPPRLPSSLPIAAAPRACLPPEFRERIALFLPDASSPLEMALASAGGRPILPLPGHGTVTGTAIELAGTLFPGEFLLLGVDLASYGYRTHARGHAFEPVVHASTSRLTPLPGQLRARLRKPVILTGEWEQSEELALYADALKGDLAAANRAVYRLAPSPVPLPATEIDAAFLPRRRRISARCGPGGERGESGVESDGGAHTREGAKERLEAYLRELGSGVSAISLAEADSSVAEELARHLALPELLRLRAALFSGEQIQSASTEVEERVRSEVERLLEETKG